MTMEVEINPDPPEDDIVPLDTEKDDIINFLILNENICFKSQQKWESDLSLKEKSAIALDIFDNSKLNFLIRFGKYLKHSQIQYFQQFTASCEPDSAEIDLVLKDLYKNVSQGAYQVEIKNRRYAALLQMIEEGTYFSDIEMMKRNPLLYEQLVGQYLTEEEKRERDKYKLDEQATFVKILMESIEREDAQLVKENQQEKEDDQLEEEDTSDEDTSDEEMERPSSPEPSSSRWGEFEPKKMNRPKKKVKAPKITAPERLLLKEEFITTMYQNFLDGKDEDFNYENVDNNASYDNMHEIEHDEEDKYFASEDVEEMQEENEGESSEDELDIYMNALNQHPAVTELSKDLKRL